jgi:hypothetical protein
MVMMLFSTLYVIVQLLCDLPAFYYVFNKYYWILYNLCKIQLLALYVFIALLQGIIIYSSD